MFTYLFWRFAIERAIKTFAQTLTALFSAGGIGLLNAPWIEVLSVAGMTALLSVLTSIASERVGEPESPSLVRSEPPAESTQRAPAVAA
ncbi:MAG TPA: holin [Pseudonocardiaceae bacterium]|nr:holin [Pseudonocardiaceae bacterium]